MNQCRWCKYYFKSYFWSHAECRHPKGNLFSSRFNNPDGSINKRILNGDAYPLCFKLNPTKPAWVLPLSIYLGLTWFVIFLYATLFVLSSTIGTISLGSIEQGSSGLIGVILWIGIAAILSLMATQGFYSGEFYKQIKWYYVAIYTVFAAGIGFLFWQTING